MNNSAETSPHIPLPSSNALVFAHAPLPNMWEWSSGQVGSHGKEWDQGREQGQVDNPRPETGRYHGQEWNQGLEERGAQQGWGWCFLPASSWVLARTPMHLSRCLSMAPGGHPTMWGQLL